MTGFSAAARTGVVRAAFAARRTAALRRLALTLRRVPASADCPGAGRCAAGRIAAPSACLFSFGSGRCSGPAPKPGSTTFSIGFFSRPRCRAAGRARDADTQTAWPELPARPSGRCGARSLPHVGQFEVHHVRQLSIVEARAAMVGGHQHVELHALEVGQRPRARALLLVAVDGGGADVGLVELLASVLAPCLVRVNTSTWCQWWSSISLISRSRFLALSTG